SSTAGTGSAAGAGARGGAVGTGGAAAAERARRAERAISDIVLVRSGSGRGSRPAFDGRRPGEGGQTTRTPVHCAGPTTLPDCRGGAHLPRAAWPGPRIRGR